MTYWAAEADEDLEDVDLNLAIGSFGQTDQYEDGVFEVKTKYPVTQLRICNDIAKSHIDETTLLAVQQQMAQQAFAQIPDVVKRVRMQECFARNCIPSHDHHSSSYISTKRSRRTISLKLRSHTKADGTALRRNTTPRLNGQRLSSSPR